MEPGSLVAPGARRGWGGCVRPLCRNFARGSCSWGQRCRFSHGTKGTAPRHRAPGRRCATTRAAFGLPRVEGEDGEENVPAPGDPPGWAVRGGFVPARARGAAGPHLKGLRRDPSSPAPSKAMETAWAQRLEDPTEHGAAAAPAPTADLRAHSEAVVCGICMEQVYGKALPEERLFGILPSCSHAFCLGCIRTWRRSRDFPRAVIKACPECRLTSPYYIPHKYWVSDGDEKQQLIKSFKARMGKIRCKFFTRNRGRCPFGSDCIYLHELPRGRPPPRRGRQRPRMRAERSPSPSESSDEEEDEFHMVEWAVTSALLELDLLYTSYSCEMFFGDGSDSD